MRYYKLSIIFVIIALFFVGANSTQAASPFSLKISPLTFNFEIKKGGSETDKIFLTNPVNYQTKINFEVEDFIMEDEQGTPKFLPKGSGKTTLASWIEVSADNFYLSPNETKEIPFTITVPANGEPGGHYAAIFFKTEPTSTKGQAQLEISGRVGALVLVSVPGQVSKTGEILEFKTPKFVNSGPVKLFVRFKNTGTVHYQLGGTIKIYNWLGKETATVQLPEHLVLPGSTRQFEGSWKANFLFGKYKARLEMKDGGGNTRTAEAIFFAFPWKIGLIILGSLLILINITYIIKRKFKIVRK